MHVRNGIVLSEPLRISLRKQNMTELSYPQVQTARVPRQEVATTRARQFRREISCADSSFFIF